MSTTNEDRNAADKLLTPFWRRMQLTTLAVGHVADACAREGLTAYSDELRGAKENLTESFHDLARIVNEEAEHDFRYLLENGGGSEAEKGSTPGDAVPPENVLEKVATTLARIACLSAQEPTGRLAEAVLRKAGHVADQQLIEVESVTGISYEDDLQGDANAWAKGRVREIAAEMEDDGAAPGDPGEVQAVRATVAEWLEHHAPRIVSGDYIEDLPD